MSPFIESALNDGVVVDERLKMNLPQLPVCVSASVKLIVDAVLWYLGDEAEAIASLLPLPIG